METYRVTFEQEKQFFLGNPTVKVIVDDKMLCELKIKTGDSAAVEIPYGKHRITLTGSGKRMDSEIFVKGMVTKDTTLNELFEAACLSADTNVQSGKTFRVKDLFRGVEWSRIPKGLRMKLGAMFFAYVNGEAKNAFEPAGKTPQNQQIYTKK